MFLIIVTWYSFINKGFSGVVSTISSLIKRSRICAPSVRSRLCYERFTFQYEILRHESKFCRASMLVIEHLVEFIFFKKNDILFETDRKKNHIKWDIEYKYFLYRRYILFIWMSLSHIQHWYKRFSYPRYYFDQL